MTWTGFTGFADLAGFETFTLLSCLMVLGKGEWGGTVFFEVLEPTPLGTGEESAGDGETALAAFVEGDF